MARQNETIDWETVQESELKKWYFTSKIMGTVFSGSFPCFTFEELWKQIQEDPQYKKKDEE